MTASDGRWRHGWVVCRICGHRHMSVWPMDIVDECAQECSRCGHLACEPEECEEDQ